MPKLTIKDDNLFFEAEVDLQKTLEIMKIANSISPPPSQTVMFNPSADSPREVLLRSKAKTNIEKIVVLGKYICHREGKGFFSARDIQEIFKRAGEAPPGNIFRDLKKTISAGYIFESNDGEFSLTNTGEKAIESSFSETINKYQKSGKKGIFRKRIIREEIKNMEIPASFQDFPDYWNIEGKGLRTLWILGFLAESNKNISDTTSSEISYIATRLRDNIPANNLSAITERLIKSGLLTTPSPGKYRILQKGLDFLKNYEPPKHT